MYYFIFSDALLSPAGKELTSWLSFVMSYCIYYYFAFILMGKREMVALLILSSWCIVIVVWLFLAVPWVCLQFVIVVFPEHTHLLCLTVFVGFAAEKQY